MRTATASLLAAAVIAGAAIFPAAHADDLTWKTSLILSATRTQYADPDARAAALRSMADRVGGGIASGRATPAQRGQLEFLQDTFSREADRAIREKPGVRSTINSWLGTENVQASCGYADGGSTAQAPTAGLCYNGTASRTFGIGPWHWSCLGAGNGATALCSGARATMGLDARCGPSHGASGLTTLFSNSSSLCERGSATGFSTSWKNDGRASDWTWTCGGYGYGREASCWASGVELSNDGWALDGKCGSANAGSYDDVPTYNLCSAGTASYVVGTGPWTWTCAGNSGGRVASCWANLRGQSVGYFPTSYPDCPAATLTANGHYYSVPAAADGKALSAGAAVAVPHGSLSLRQEFTCRSGAWRPTGSEYATASCDDGYLASAEECVRDQQSSQWPDGGTCGSAQGGTYSSRPWSNLCAQGQASSVNANGSRWEWSCDGGNHNGASCWAYKNSGADGRCGSADGAYTAAKPSYGLCASGWASTIAGTGPWMWTCYATDGGGSDSCSSYKQEVTNGRCGSSVSKTFETAPSESLCFSGYATPVTGGGAWNWTCRGSVGGVSAMCQARVGASTAATCGTANGRTYGSLAADASSLCASGVASQFTAVVDASERPLRWTWNCRGNSSGFAATCSASATR